MSDDNFTEITSTSWLSRIGRSFIGVLIGIALIIGAGVLLFWNEGRAVQTAKSLAEGSALVIDVDPGRIDPASEGKLVHVSGDIKTGSRISDPEFGVSTDGIRLVRTAEMYQWKEDKKTETHKNMGGSEETTTTYSYSREWSASRNDSNKFRHPDGHGNPDMRYRGATVVSKDASLGQFRPGAAVLSQLPASDAIQVDPSTADALRGRVAGPVQVDNGGYYLGADPAQPHIGDMRITFHAAPQGPASIVGEQKGRDFSRYQTKAGDRLLMVKPGTVSAADMFKSATEENRLLTWALRLVGAVAMWIGFMLLSGPLVVIADVVPLIGGILDAGATLAALLITVVIAPVIIAIAWLWYRPLVSIGALVIGAVLAFVLKKLVGRKASGRTANPAPAR